MGTRQAPTAIVVPSVLTGTAYNARDTIGKQFEMPLVAGSPGGIIGATQIIDKSSGNMALRLHLYSRQPSAYDPTGITYVLADTDEDAYLGYINFSTWVSAGASKMVAQNLNPGMSIFASGGTRSIWGVVEAPNGGTFGGVTNPLSVKMTVLQDYS